MPVFLIRHAHAGSRSAWNGDDARRPLSKKGLTQAANLSDRLAAADIGRVLSSPMLRCVQTAQPIADSHGHEVETHRELSEGADPDQVLGEVFELASANPVIVGHGDLIPRLLARLVANGMKASHPDRCQKGSLWVIEIDDGRPLRATYEAPLAVAKL